MSTASILDNSHSPACHTTLEKRKALKKLKKDKTHIITEADKRNCLIDSDDR